MITFGIVAHEIGVAAQFAIAAFALGLCISKCYGTEGRRTAGEIEKECA